MAKLTFVSSANVKFNLHDFDSAKLKDANFHKVSWLPEYEQKQYGVKVNRFTKDAQLFDCVFKFRGSYSRRKQQIDDFIYQTEQDISRMSPGRIYWDEEYIQVYFNVHSTYPDEDDSQATIIEGQFFAPFPFWIEEQKISIFPSQGAVEGLPENVKGYPTDRDQVYGYEYAYPWASTAVLLNVDSALSSNFKAVIYGPCNFVQFYIDSHRYRVDYELRYGQYMVIDSRDTVPFDKRCYVRNENGSEVNVFDYRDPTSLLFKKIPNGHIILNYPRTYGIDLTIFQERSAPK